MTPPPYLDEAELMSLVSWTDAIAAIADALSAGIASGPPRSSLPTAGGELLLMPAATADVVGIKLAGIAPDNPAAGLPRIQAVYVLFDAATMTPQALIDGTALTTLRTPAQSALAVRDLAVAGAESLVVFGSGPQAWGHVEAIRAVRPIRKVTVVGRNSERAQALVDQIHADCADDLVAEVGMPEDVRGADVVVCATTARQPVFDGALLADHACVVAVGSHEPEARELDDLVFSRASLVVVEDRETALREAGDVIQAIAAGALVADRIVELVDRVSVDGITVFKGVGMAWQDLAVAESAYSAWRERGPR